MNKEELVSSIAAESGETKAAVARMLEGFTETVGFALRQGETVKIVGFGTFEARTSKPRACRNPRTGEIISIPSKTTAKFSAGKTLNDRVGD